MNKITTALLATTYLTMVSTGAGAVALVETTDFSDTFAGADTVAFGTYQEVEGELDRALSDVPADVADFFKFTGLMAGTSYHLLFENFNDGYSTFRFGVWTAGPTLADSRDVSAICCDAFAGSDSLDFTPTGTTITIGVESYNGFSGSGLGPLCCGAEGYRVSLSVASIPEPATLGLFTLGAAGIGFSRRRKKRAETA